MMESEGRGGGGEGSSVYMALLCRNPMSHRSWAQSKTTQGAEEEMLPGPSSPCVLCSTLPSPQ